ncbi:otoancorin-like, partial [Cetorhinus maximus]
ETDSGPVLMDCVERTPSSMIAWRSLRANLSRMSPLEFKILLKASTPFLKRVKTKGIEKLPVLSNITMVETMMKMFRMNHCALSIEVRTSIFNWARKSLMLSLCRKGEGPEGERDKGRSAGCGGKWMNNSSLEILGPFVIAAPAKVFDQITPRQICQLYNNLEFAKGLNCMFKIQPSRGKHILSMLSGTCLNLTKPSDIQRLGALSCFFEDVGSLDNSSAMAFLSEMRSCSNAAAKKNAGRLVNALLKGRVPGKKDLKQLGSAASCLSHKILKRISNEDVRDSIPELGKEEGLKWTKRQARLLVDKFLKAGGKIISLKELGSLASGVPSKTLRNMTGEQMLQSMNSSDAIKSIRGSFIKEVSLASIQEVEITNLVELSDRPWNEGQALLLLNGTESISATELGQLGPLIQGLTCEMMQKYADHLGLNISQTLANVTTWLSRKQLSCVAKKLKTILDNLEPDIFSENLDAFLQPIPSEILLFLGEEYACQRFAKACGTFLEKVEGARLELLPRSSPVRACVRDAAVHCLSDAMSTLDETDVGQLGLLVCEFTGQNISDLPDDVFLALIPQLGKCRQFHSTAGSSLSSKLLDTLGVVSQWTADTVASLGSMITLLGEDMLLQLPNTTAVKDALLEYSASQAAPGPAVLPEFDTSGVRIQSQTKIFILVVGDPAGDDSWRTRAASCSKTPTSEEIQELGEANALWTPKQLMCMSTETFEDTIDVLASIYSFSDEQRVALMDKAVEAWGATSSFTQEEIANLKSLISVLPASEIKSLDLRSIDNLESMAFCPTWTQEKRAVVLQRFLELSGMTAADLGSIEISGLGSFVCGMKADQITQLRDDEIKFAANSLGKLTCSPETLDLLKDKVTKVFGPMGSWSEAQVSELGNIVAGASVNELKSLDSTIMPYLATTAVRLIPPDRFQALSVSQLEKLGPENAAAVSQSQMEALSEEQKSAVKDALGVPTRFSYTFALSHSPSLSIFGLVQVAHTLLMILLLFV